MRKRSIAIITAVLAVLSGILYRMGGVGKPYPTKSRDIGCSALTVGFLAMFGVSWGIIVALVLSFALMWAGLSMYWKKKGTDPTFWSFYRHGMGVAVAMAPYAYVTGHWLGFAIRVALLPFLVAYLGIYGNRKILCWRGDVVSEFTRGFVIMATVPLLLI